jgi:hypothetical protein
MRKPGLAAGLFVMASWNGRRDHFAMRSFDRLVAICAKVRYLKK